MTLRSRPLSFAGIVLVSVLPWACQKKASVSDVTRGSRPIPVATGAGPGADEAAVEPVKIVLVGHLYSLYRKQRYGKIYTERVVELFVREMDRIGPEAIFFLGDTTRDSSEEEWSMLERHLSPLKAQRYFIPGNHDLNDVDAYRRHGGAPNRSVVLGGVKLIMLDTKNIYGSEDLEYLKRELADHERYKTICLLTHYMGFFNRPPSAAPPDIDVNQPYSRYGNWNADIVPLLEDKVQVVFCGDLFPRWFVGTYQTPDEKLTYVCNGFGHMPGGPLVFVEIVLQEGEIKSMVPRTLPLDLRDEWYRLPFPSDREEPK